MTLVMKKKSQITMYFSLDELKMLADVDLNNDIIRPITPHEELFKGINMLKNNRYKLFMNISKVPKIVC